MQNMIVRLFGVLIFAGIIFSSCNNSKKNEAMTYTDAPSLEPTIQTSKKPDLTGEINWISWAEAVEKNKTAKKKVFVDMYTDWCGWCKRMDATTFIDASVADYMNENFYAVKFNAEQKGPIEFRGQTFEFTKAGRRGAHGLAVALLDGRLGYPAFVYLDENMDRISISPGYKKAPEMVKELNWVGSNSYKNQKLEEYSN